MPVSPGDARRAAALLRAYAEAGVLGTDPEVLWAVADLCGFAEQGGETMGVDFTDAVDPVRLRAAMAEADRLAAANTEYLARVESDRAEGLRRVRELEAEVAVLRAERDRLAASLGAVVGPAAWDRDPPDEVRRALVPGDRVLVRWDDGEVREYAVRRAPWETPSGAWLVGLSRVVGGYDLSRVVAVWRHTPAANPEAA